MEKGSHNEELIVRYLLGDLSDDEQQRLEDRAFSERRYIQEIVAVEDDLIDDYIRGSLSERERRQFEDRFLASHERRQKVAFASALAKIASLSTAAATAHPPVTARRPSSWWDSFIGIIRDANPTVKLSMAAASLAIVIGIPWSLAQRAKLHGEIERLQAEHHAEQARQANLERQISDEQARSAELTERLQREREQREMDEERTRPHKGRSQPAPPQIASLILWPGISRSENKSQQLVIPRAARLTHLQIVFEREDEYQGFRVEIRTAQGREVWVRDNLRPRQSQAGRVVDLIVPQSAFRTGRYELILKGVIDHQVYEDVRYYYLDVLKK